MPQPFGHIDVPWFWYISSSKFVSHITPKVSVILDLILVIMWPCAPEYFGALYFKVKVTHSQLCVQCKFVGHLCRMDIVLLFHVITLYTCISLYCCSLNSSYPFQCLTWPLNPPTLRPWMMVTQVVSLTSVVWKLGQDWSPWWQQGLNSQCGDRCWVPGRYCHGFQHSFD